MDNKPKFRVNLRHEARKLALQALYAWQLSATPILTIQEDLFEGDISLFDEPKECDTAYFNELTSAIVRHASTLDEQLVECLDRSISQINPVELAILRIGAYELYYRSEIPYRVVLNEGIILAKKFGASDSHKYVNGVLDKLAQKMRFNEIHPGSQLAAV